MTLCYYIAHVPSKEIRILEKWLCHRSAQMAFLLDIEFDAPFSGQLLVELEGVVVSLNPVMLLISPTRIA